MRELSEVFIKGLKNLGEFLLVLFLIYLFFFVLVGPFILLVEFKISWALWIYILHFILLVFMMVFTDER